MKSESRFFRSAATAFALAVLPGVVSAKPPATPKEPSSEVRILPVGEVPELKMRMEGGRYMQAPYEPGQAPPERVVPRGAKTPRSVPLSLNRVSRIPAGVKPGSTLVLEAPGAGGAPATPWCEAKVPAGRALVLVRPDARGSWLKPVVETVDLSPKSIGGAGVRLLNRGVSPVHGVLGTERFSLKPGEQVEVPASKIKGDARFRMSEKSSAEVDIDRTVSVAENEIRFLIVYPSKGVPGRRIALCEFTEHLAEPPVN